MSSAAVPVQAVIFDWAGTLTPWHVVQVSDSWRALANGLGEPGLAPALIQADAQVIKAAQSHGHSARLEEVLAAVGVREEHPLLGEALQAYFAFWEPHTFTDPLVAPMLHALRERGIATGVLSNTIWSREYHEGVFARDGVAELFEATVYSSELEHAKPHPGAFEAARLAVGASSAAACVYVGDRMYEDVHGAQAAGMRAIWIPHSQIPEAEQVAVGAVPEATIHALDELVGVIDTWNAATG